MDAGGSESCPVVDFGISRAEMLVLLSVSVKLADSCIAVRAEANTFLDATFVGKATAEPTRALGLPNKICQL